MEDGDELTWRAIGRVRPPVDVELDDWKKGAYFGQDPSGEADPYNDEYIELLGHHPAFRYELTRLWEDLELQPYPPKYPDEGVSSRPHLSEVRANRDELPLPIAQFAKKWALDPADVVGLLSGTDVGEVGRIALIGERYMIHVKETDAAYLLRIPKPLSPTRKKTVEAWLTAAHHREDHFKKKALGDKVRPSLRPALMEDLPWFDLWVENKMTAAQIYNSPERRDALSEDTIRKSIRRIWERLREISPERLPTKGP